ncbi:MAG: alpha-2-macroglobulin family protein [Bacteroidales bacterium]
MNKLNQFILGSILSFTLATPEGIIAQNRPMVKADLTGIDRQMVLADSLDQPQRVIELAGSLFSLAQRTGDGPFQYRALSYRLRNQIRLNPTNRQSHLDDFLSKTETMKDADYKAIGLLFYLEQLPRPYLQKNDSATIKQQEVSKKLLHQLALCKDYSTKKYDGLLQQNALTRSIAPTLDIYLAASYLQNASWDKEKNLHREFSEILLKSGKRPASMYGKYLSSLRAADAYVLNKERIYTLIEEYNDIPEVGILYDQLGNEPKKDQIPMLERYIKQFPGTEYAVLLQNKIDNLKASSISLTFPVQVPVKDKTPISISHAQSNGFGLTLTQDQKDQRIFFPLTIPQNYESDTTSNTLPVLKPGEWSVKLDSNDNKTPLYISQIADYEINHKIYAVDFETGKPMQDILVTFKNDQNKIEQKLDNGVLDVRTLRNKLENNYYWQYQLRKGKQLSAPGSFFAYINEPKESIPEYFSCVMLSGKPIYRPGDSITFKGWAWNATPFGLKQPEPQAMQVFLVNTSNLRVDSVNVTLDKFGTFSGAVKIPAYGLNGYYLLKTDITYANQKRTTRRAIRVEAYQAPTFQVDVKSDRTQYGFTDSAVIQGSVLSFNGLPVKEEEVRYEVKFEQLYRYMTKGRSFEVTGKALTDDKGNFSFKVPLTESKQMENLALRGIVTTTVTNKNGETEKGVCSFAISDKPYYLSLNIEKYIDLSDDQTTVQVTTQHTSEKSTVQGNWKMLDKDGNTVKNGNWKADEKFSLDLPADFKIGKYKLIAETEKGIRCEEEVVVYSSRSTTMPVDQTLLLIGKKDNQLLVGTSEKEIHIRSIWKLGNKPAEEKWVTLKKGLHAWPLPEIEKGYDGMLTLVTVKNKKIWKEDYRVSNPIEQNTIQLSIETFRDHLTPGAKETWSMTLSQNGKPLNEASTLAYMYDEALNKLEGFNPALNMTLPTFNPSNYLRAGSCFGSNYLNYSPYYPLNNDSIQLATQLLFGFDGVYSEQGAYYGGRPVVGYGRTKGAPGLTMAKRTENMEMAYVAVENDQLADESSIRTDFADCAFFYPNLPVNSEGKVTFSFTLPDLITTWRFVAISNNEKMEVGQIQRSFVASKELMLQINKPRFLRQGDQTEIEASLSYLKPYAGKTKVIMELVDPVSEKVISSAEQVVSGQEQVRKVNFPLIVPVQSDRIIVRMRAANSDFSDGEQYLIPILSDNIELTETLELNTGGSSNATFQWKELNENTLNNNRSDFRIELVKNPAWYAVHALSALLNPNSASSDALINAYFANTLGGAIAKANPEIETYLIDKAKSPLTGKVENTPWIADEQKESKQIEQALILFEPGQVDYLRGSALMKLKLLQNPDGGFSWYPGMWSSLWQTLTVLQRMGELTELGVIEYGQEEKILQINALKYIDKYIAETYQNELKYKNTDKPLNQTQALILYVRAMYMDIPLTGETLTGHKNWTSRASKSWIRNDLYTKSLLANALFSYGFTNEAQQIVTSILNYGATSPTLGFWFPSNRNDQLQTHVAMMRLMLQPQVNQPERFEKMKWWLIAQKQNRMWLTNTSTVDAVYALTMQGMNVLKNTGTVTVMLGNRTLNSGDQMILSERVSSQELIRAKGEIRVLNQTSLPVFGALYHTFRSPLKSVKGNNKGSLQIRKEIIRNSTEALKIGEEVTVRLTVKSDQQLDFVRIADQLAACYQPVDQQSGHTWEQVSYYRELTNEGMNLYVERLPRGTTVFEYKVWINRPGEYQSGVAKIESIYSPQFTNYSDNCQLKVK